MDFKTMKDMAKESISELKKDIVNSVTKVERGILPDEKVTGMTHALSKPPKMVLKKGLNMKTLPPKIKGIVERGLHDEYFYKAVQQICLVYFQNILLQANQKHETFCDFFAYKKTMPDKLLKVFGITKREMIDEFKKLSMDKDTNKMYDDEHYQVMLIVYLMGLAKDDPQLRANALILIAIRLWNGRALTYWEKGCNPDIALYVIQFMVKNNFIYKKYRTPLMYIMKNLVPNIDKKYSAYVRQDPSNPTQGVPVLIVQTFVRINQTMKGLARHYYKAYEEGKSISVSSAHGQAYDSSGDMVEMKETINTVIEKLIDKISKNSMVQKDVIYKKEIFNYLQAKYFVSYQSLSEINDFLNDEDNTEDLKLVAELMLNGLQPKTEDEFCQYDNQLLINTISGSKKNEHYLKIKSYINDLFRYLYSHKGEMPQSSEYRLRNILTAAVVLYIKKLACG